MAKAASEVRDPVCGKSVDPLRARAVGIFGGVTFYFCSAECKAKYKDPRKAERPPGAPVIPPSIRALAAEEERSTRPASQPAPAKPDAAVPQSPDRTLDAWVASAPKSGETAVETGAELNLRDVDHDDESGPTADAPAPPSPSLAAELKATRPSPRRAWVIVSLLFVVAAAVLFFSLRSR